MPTYVYKFLDSGETIEVQQSFSDDSLTEYVHPESGELRPVKKVFQPVGVTFKGSGFFKTDNREGKAKTKAKVPSESGSTSDSSADSGSADKSTSSKSSDKGSSDAGSSASSGSSGSSGSSKSSVAASAGTD